MDINIDHLTSDNMEDVVDTICHEAYHSFEYQLVKQSEYNNYVNMKSRIKAQQYKDEFKTINSLFAA